MLAALLWSCQENNPAQQQDSPAPGASEQPAASINGEFKDLFEEVNVVKMHLFAAHEPEPNPDNYPYVGKPVPSALAQYLPDGLQVEKGVFACYRTENSGHYILRVPDQAGTSDLVLCRWDPKAGKLAKVADLAFLRCTNGNCQQQDAWLADLDDNRLLELIVRSHKRDSKGMVTDETFDVMTDDGSGSFTKSNEQLASLAVKSNYVMQ